MTPETMDGIRRAVADGDPSEVQVFLDAHPSQVLFNVKRVAIQFVACNGSIRELLPVSSDMARHLATAVN